MNTFTSFYKNIVLKKYIHSLTYSKVFVRKPNNSSLLNLKRYKKDFSNDFSKQRIIENEHYPICNDCYFFKKHHSDDDMDKCTKFGHKNLINGDVIYHNVSFIRSNESFCGEHGRHFMEKEEKKENK